MRFEIFYPTVAYKVNQGWAVNGDYYRKNGINILGHNGLDLKAVHGQPIYAAHDGVAYYEIDEQQGHGVVIVSSEEYDWDTELQKFV